MGEASARTPAATTLNQRWAATLVGALAKAGVRHAVIAPGSRSTPLALAFADRPDVRCWSVLDERSAAFFALGLAKADQRPAAVLATSGTAGAHFLPAAMEAVAGATPLVLLTADRPWELHGFGAAQTADQSSLFGGFVRDTCLLDAPLDEPACFAHLAAVVTRAAGRAAGPPRGPVHLNAPFREPLTPLEAGSGPLVDPAVAACDAPRVDPDVRAVVEAVRGARRGLVVLGPREREDGVPEAVHRVAAQLGFPVFAEAASNARFGAREVVSLYDALLRSPRFADAARPDVVLRFGGGLTSKALQAWLDASGARTFHFSDDGLVFDPLHRAERVLTGDAREACERLLAAVRSDPAGGAVAGGEAAVARGAFRRHVLEAQAAAEARLEAWPATLSEPLVARAVVRALPDGANLVLSSSMPIRDVDAFASRARGRLRVFANRGVNGIDGVVSTALGVAAASRRPTALLVGDVALLHDLHAWVAAKRLAVPLAAVVVNNDGGGIFHFLPVAGRTAHFEALFGTPHGVDLAAVAALGGARHHRPADLAELERLVPAALEGGLHLVEVRTDRVGNVAAHTALLAQLAGAPGAEAGR